MIVEKVSQELLLQQVLEEKLRDAQTPGYQVPFDPYEAEIAGAFVEDAIEQNEAFDSAVDLPGTNLHSAEGNGQ